MDIKKCDIYVDFGGGDKFKVEVDEIDEEKGVIRLRGSQGQLGWVRLDVTHPIKTKRDESSKS